MSAQTKAQRPGQLSWSQKALVGLAAASVVLPLLLSGALGITLDQQDLTLGARPPGWPHLAGTDLFGRDLLARTSHGLRMSMAVGLCGSAVASGIGTAVGLLSGYVGGMLDAWIMRATDVLYALPLLFLAIVLVALCGNHPLLVFAALGAVGWLTAARMVRAHVLAEREQPYVAALRLLGASHSRIVLLHILPNSLGVVAVAFGLSVPSMVLEEAFLSFIGLGVQPPFVSLGTLIGEGMDLVRLTGWPLGVPALALSALLLLLHRVTESAAGKLDHAGDTGDWGNSVVAESNAKTRSLERSTGR